MLADEHGVTIREEEDPIRMLYTLIKVFLVNQEQLLDSQRIKYAEQVEATSGATLGLALDLVREFAEKLPEINQGTQAIQQESAPQQSQIRSIPPVRLLPDVPCRRPDASARRRNKRDILGDLMLEALRYNFGPVVTGALDDENIMEIMLNDDGKSLAG